jgi:2-keto-3-deoxy-6-phosphogluconate aldolase/predicted enzyme related to lactoylglutathione lyase
MPKVNQIEVYKAIKASGMVVIIPPTEVKFRFPAIQAFFLGGAHLIALPGNESDTNMSFVDLFSHCKAELPDLLLGACPTNDIETVDRCLQAGADFIIGLTMEESIARLCNRYKTAYIPACNTSKDILNAAEFGLEIIQLPKDMIQETSGSGQNILIKFHGMRIVVHDDLKAVIERGEKERLQTWFKLGVSAVLLEPSWTPIEKDIPSDSESITTRTAQIVDWIYSIKSDTLFQGIEHVGLYQSATVSAREIADWYGKIFGFKIEELPKCVLIEGNGAGRIEVVKEAGPSGIHIAIGVADLGAAIRQLKSCGIEVEPPVTLPGIRWAYLVPSDPVGNRVHLVWRKSRISINDD